MTFNPRKEKLKFLKSLDDFNSLIEIYKNTKNSDIKNGLRLMLKNLIVGI